MTTLTYYLFTDIPGAGKGWTLAVLATGQHDARRYVNTYNGGGRYLGTNKCPDEHQANCGAVTPAAQAILEARLQ